MDGWIRSVHEGCRPMVMDAPEWETIVGSGELSNDGEDFAFENGRLE